MLTLLTSTILALSGGTIALILLGVLFFIGFILVVWAIKIYNKLVTLRNRYKKSFADIDVQLKRRHDLIPNLVETAKGYMSHESETLEAVIAARNLASDARQGASADDSSSMGNLAQAESGLGGALSRLMMVTESYPDLKADRQMSELSEELTAATDYNDHREVFPNNLFTNIFNFAEATMFEVSSDEEREAVKVEF